MVESDLPRPKSWQIFLWSLIDKPVEDARSYIVMRPCFPVQTTSPNPLRYKVWLKDNNPMFTALPLWTREELARGYVSQPYVFFSSFENYQFETSKILQGRMCLASQNFL